MAARRGSGLRTSVLVAAFALVACSSASAQIAAPSARCAGAKALQAHGLLEQAKTSYTRLALSKNPPPCAARGLKRVVDKLEAAAPGKPDPCAGAQALADQGLLEEAKDAFEKLASGADPPPCAAKGLKAVKDSIADDRTLPERAGERADTLFAALADLLKLALFFVIVIALAGALALRFGPLAHYVRRRAWLRSRPDLGASKAKRRAKRLWRALMTPFVWAVATPVKIEELKGSGDDEGPDMTRAITGLMPVVSARRSSMVQVALAPFAAKSALGEVTEAISGVPHGKAVAAVLSVSRRLVPRVQLHVTGSLLTSDTRGTGLALEIANDAGDVVDAETMWSKEFDPYAPPGKSGADAKADRTLRLATAGAVWVLFAVLRYRRALELDDWRRFLGTPAWRSYALFLITVTGSHAPDQRTAQAGYAQALEHDPANLPALFNLAMADVSQDDWDQAVERLTDVANTLAEREQAEARIDRDPLRYQAAYSLAYARLSATSEANHAEIDEIADTLAKDLVDLERTLRDLDAEDHRPTQDHDDLYMQLQRFEGPLLTLWAYLRAVSRPHQRPTKNAPPLTRGDVFTGLEKNTLKHPDLVRDLASKPTSVRPRTQYNLASYYALVGRMDDARSALKTSLELGTLADNAESDPQLKPLRDDDPAAFENILAEYLPDAPTGLGRIAAIGQENANALSELGIDTEEQLVRRARTAEERATLAGDAGVGSTLVERWARLADLRKLGIVDVPSVNMLDAAGVGSRGALAQMTAPALMDLLKSVKPLPPGASVPTSETVKKWIQRAKAKPGSVKP